MHMRTNQIAKTLRELVLKKLRDQMLAEADQQKLEAAIDALLEKDAAVEQDTIEAILEDLDEHEDAGEVMLTEMETSSELAYFGKHREHCALAFAIPVALLAGDRYRDVALSTDDTLEMVRVLEDSQVVGSHTRIGILPRLFSPAELSAQSYGMLQRLTRSLGRKLRDREPVRLENGILRTEFTPVETYPWGDNPHVDLRFLVGAAYTPSELEHVFPPVGPEEVDGLMPEADETGTPEDMTEDAGDDAAENGDGRAKRGVVETLTWARAADADRPRGFMPDGEFWETAFCESVTNAFMSMRGCRGAVLPLTLHDALRTGQEYWREFGLDHQVSMGFHPDERVLVHCMPYEDTETDRIGWDIELRGEDGTIRDTVRWEILLHESSEESEERLREICHGMGWTIESFLSVSDPV